MLAPKLRFKDDNGREFSEWKSGVLGDLLTLKYGKEYSTLNKGNIPVLGTGGVITYVDQYLYDKPSVLIGRKGTIDNPQFINKPFWTVDTLFYSELNKDFDPFYITLITKRINWYRYNEATGVPSLSASTVHKIPVFTSSNKKEQTKIANFLTTLDARINQQEKQCQLLEQYKKGMMQQLFSQELRFKDDNGEEFPRWQEASLGQLFEQRIERAEGSELLLSVTQHQGIVKYEDLDRKDNSSDDKTNYLKVYNGDIAYNSMRMWQGASGKSYWNGIVSPAYTVLKGNEQISTDFFCYLFKTDFAIHLFKKYSQGLTSDTWNLKYNKFSKIEISFPCLEEQTKIAHFLSTLDNKITLAKQQLEQLNTYKKGLLQQLFI